MTKRAIIHDEEADTYSPQQSESSRTAGVLTADITPIRKHEVNVRGSAGFNCYSAYLSNRDGPEMCYL